MRQLFRIQSKCSLRNLNSLYRRYLIHVHDETNSKISAMDELFEASFSTLDKMGGAKLKTKCGKCKRYMNFIPLKYFLYSENSLIILQDLQDCIAQLVKKRTVCLKEDRLRLKIHYFLIFSSIKNCNVHLTTLSWFCVLLEVDKRLSHCVLIVTITQL